MLANAYRLSSQMFFFDNLNSHPFHIETILVFKLDNIFSNTKAMPPLHSVLTGLVSAYDYL